MVTNFSDLDLTKTYSYADYLTWVFTERVELIKGMILKMSPAPNRFHQKVSSRISSRIERFLYKKPCQMYYAPFDVRFPKKKQNQENQDIYTVVQPDLCVICDESKLDDKGCIGAPDLIIEILSSSNSKHDLVTKKRLYEENGVLEYWVVYPYEKVIMKYVLQNQKYTLESEYTEEDIIQTAILPGFELKMDDIFYE
jgi:Uma2 family endonuclease